MNTLSYLRVGRYLHRQPEPVAGVERYEDRNGNIGYRVQLGQTENKPKVNEHWTDGRTTRHTSDDPSGKA